MFEVHPIALELGEIFQKAGFELALVGGSVRDILLKRSSNDLDFTTNATPDEVKELLSNYLDDLWDIGKEFGTIGGNKYIGGKPTHERQSNDETSDDGQPDQTPSPKPLQIEVTTYRSDKYDEESRKPVVEYGTTLQADLSRRDFTINAIALSLPDVQMSDPFAGILDLGKRLLRTPIEPQKSFADDPLRMLRAVRFAAQLDFRIEAETAAAIIEMKDRLEIISKERIRDEFTKMMLSDNPMLALDTLVDLELIDYVVPELRFLKMEIDPAHHHKDVYAHTLKVLGNAITLEEKYLGKKDLVIRLAALFHDIAKPNTKRIQKNGAVTFRAHDVVGAKITSKRLRTLRFENNISKKVSKLVELHMRFYGYGDAKWTDSAVRRYAHDAGDLLPRLHVLTRSDVTTQNKKKASRLAHAYDDIEKRIQEIREKEEFQKIRPDLDGHEIMQILGLQQGRKDGWKIGKAYDYLLNYRIENGPVDKDTATKLLLEFAEKEFQNGK